ncbi:MAG: helix-turn-helix domain-containing protein [Allosphingosinicella sp.]
MADQDFDGEFASHSIGERLRLTRESKGISLDEVASQTRIPIRHLQHIEREEWDALPATTYCVGFAKAYANTIGLDGPEIARQLRDRLGGTRTRAPAPEYYEPTDPARVPPKSTLLIVAVVLVLFITGYLIWRSTLDEEPTTPGVEVSVPETDAPQTQVQPGQAQPPQPQALAGQAVTLAAAEEVWLRISDGNAALFQGTLQPGQRFAIPPTAQRPVLRTARPQVVRLEVGGRDIGPVELAERTVDNVSLRAEDLAARFQAPSAAPPPQAR